MAPTFIFTNSRGVRWYLHGMDVTLKNGYETRIYYFSRSMNEERACDLPEGYEPMETERTGMPVLRKV